MFSDIVNNLGKLLVQNVSINIYVIVGIYSIRYIQMVRKVLLATSGWGEISNLRNPLKKIFPCRYVHNSDRVC